MESQTQTVEKQDVMKDPGEFKYQLSEWVSQSRVKKEIGFMQEQLEKYGDVEGIDFIYKWNENNYMAIFTRGDRHNRNYDFHVPGCDVVEEEI